MSVAAASEPLDLEQAIEQCITLGLRDPAEIVQKLHDRFGDDWMRQQGAMYADDIANYFARKLIGQQRRRFEVAIRPGAEITSTEMKSAGIWIPGKEGFSVWKRVADCTADDLRAKAAYYELIGMKALKRAHWCFEVAEMMDADGCKTLKGLRRELPPLPEDEDLSLPEPS